MYGGESMRKKMFIIVSLMMVASMVLGACAGTATPPPAVENTVVVTQIKEVPGATTVVTQVQVVTATPGPEQPEVKPAVLRINIATYPDVIDPQKSSFVNEIAHLQMIYEGLTRLDEKLETVPGAAEKWEYNADATEVTFTLRKDLKYSDGSLLNAKRYEYSIMRNINP